MINTARTMAVIMKAKPIRVIDGHFPDSRDLRVKSKGQQFDSATCSLVTVSKDFA